MLAILRLELNNSDMGSFENLRLTEISEWSENAKTLLAGLEGRYAEPWRYYHTGVHVTALFNTLNRFVDHVQYPETVAWSILYHDTMYDPTAPRGRNEELSARLAESELRDILDYSVVKKVAQYVRATAQHVSGELDSDMDFFLDADLAILGAAPDYYDRYAANIQKEYAHVPSDQYRIGRIAVLQGLATRFEPVGLFRTKLFRDNYEIQAQENITRETDQLRTLSHE